MPTTNDPIHQLIQSLSQAEKRYFRIFSKRHSNRNASQYDLLFDAISRQATYDEAALKTYMAEQGYRQNFAGMKHYLRRVILLAMREYKREKDAYVQTYGMITDGDFLWGKRLYAQAAKTYNKALKSARQEGLPALEVMALQKLRVDRVTRQRTGVLETLDELDAQSNAAAECHSRLAQLEVLYFRLFFIARHEYNLRQEELGAQVKAILADPLLHPEAPYTTFREQMLLLKIRAVQAQLATDFDSNHRLRKQIVALWEAHPDRIKADTNAYLISLSNFASAGNLINDFSESLAIADKIRHLPVSSPDEAAENFQNLAYHELLYFLNTADFEAARARVPEIVDGLETYADKLNDARKLTFWYNLMVLFFMLEEHSKALHYLNLIMGDGRSEHRQDIQQVARLFQLILHYELGHWDILPDLMRSVYRYLRSRARLLPFEKFVLRVLAKLDTVTPDSDLRPHFGEMHEELLTLSGDQKEGHAPGLPEIRMWLQSKRDGISLADVAQGAR